MENYESVMLVSKGNTGKIAYVEKVTQWLYLKIGQFLAMEQKDIITKKLNVVSDVE